MDDQQEQQVARGLREGKTEAWRALYDAYSGRVWRWVARLMGPQSADVADVVQETFLAAARSARGYDAGRGSLWTWLGGIARKHVALHYRKQRRHDRIKDAGAWLAAGNAQVVRWLENCEEAPAEALAAAELATLVRVTLTELPAEYGTLLTAMYCDGASVDQIAGLEKCSSTAVRSKLARARRAFRRAFVRTSTCSSNGQARGYHEP
jgi:RNA polymerase sigma-70 factor (ECF subfamily)